MNKQLKKCDFCTYWTGKGCMVTPNSAYCKNAIAEMQTRLYGQNTAPVKSLRKWDRK